MTINMLNRKKVKLITLHFTDKFRSWSEQQSSWSHFHYQTMSRANEAQMIWKNINIVKSLNPQRFSITTTLRQHLNHILQCRHNKKWIHSHNIVQWNTTCLYCLLFTIHDKKGFLGEEIRLPLHSDNCCITIHFNICYSQNAFYQ